MNTVVQQLIDFFGPLGSPYWWIVGFAIGSIFLAQWARAIRTLLPFIGAGTIIGIILWTLVKANVIVIAF